MVRSHTMNFNRMHRTLLILASGRACKAVGSGRYILGQRLVTLVFKFIQHKTIHNMSNRIKYKTPINFPATFTLRELRKANHHKIKYITIYSRVRKAVAAGTLVEAGFKQPEKSRRGRKEAVYKTVTIVAPEVATIDVAVPAVTNW